jgi:virginiamycin B lyase
MESYKSIGCPEVSSDSFNSGTMKVLLLFILLITPFIVLCQQHVLPDTIPISEVAFTEFSLEGYPDFLAADGNDIWVLNTNRIEKITVQGKRPVITVPIPDACGALVVGYHAVWVASCKEQSIYRVDHKTGKILAIIRSGIADLHGEISLAVGDNAVWVLSDSAGLLSRINPNTNRVEAKIAVLPNSYCAAYGYHSVWITNTAKASVQRIDPKTNSVVATIPVGPMPRFLATGENGVWVLNQGDGSVSHIAPASNKTISTINTAVPGTGGDVAAGAGRIWIRATKGCFLQTIHPINNYVLAIYTPLSGSGAVRVTNQNIWVSAHDINTIWILKK